MTPKHPKEIEARLRKATKLAAHLHAHGILASELSRINNSEWHGLALAIGVNAPSEETIAVVDRMLRELESAQALRDHSVREAV